jgi:hypothetical protein
MREIVERALRRLAGEGGQTTFEYVLLLAAVVALVAIFAVSLGGLGGPLGDLLRSVF